MGCTTVQKIKIEEEQVCVDVWSLYSTVKGFSDDNVLGFDCLYPIGKCWRVNSYQGKEKIGFYEVLIKF